MTLPSPHLMVVEIAPGGDPADPASWTALWVDITSYVRLAPGVTLSAGRSDEGQQVDASVCGLTLDNTDGRFSPHNPNGAYYPDLSQNTPLRVRWDATVLFTGFVSEWPPRWDLSGNDSFVPIQADGVLRRLRQNSTPLRSLLYRHALAEATPPVAYWPCEDPDGATFAASAVDGPALRPNLGRPDIAEAGSTVEFGSSRHAIGSTGAVEVPVGWSMAASTGVTTGGDWTWEAWIDFGDASTSPQAWWVISTPGLGQWDWYRWRVSAGTYQLVGFDNDDPLVVTNVFGTASPESLALWPGGNLIGTHHLVLTADFTLPGTTVFRLYLDGVEINNASRSIVLNPVGSVSMTVNSSDNSSVALSHLAMWESALSAAAVLDRYDAGRGWPGETAATRITRLCLEEGVGFTLTGTAADTMAMGPQTAAAFMQLLGEAEAADGGMLIENGGGLSYITRTNRYNQAVTLAIDVDSGEVADTPEPTDDDQQLVNDVEVQRSAGGTCLVSDAASIAAHGTYGSGVTVNIDDEADCPRIAGWLLHLGTVDEMRWPRIGLDLARNSALIATWLTLQAQPGKRLTVDHTITQLPGIDVDLLADGWTQRLGQFTWDVELNCVPASPWKVGVLDSASLGHLDTAGSTLAASVTSTATSLSVATSTGPVWTQAAGDLPFDIVIGGEVMRVTAVTGASSPQTFTITRSINSVVKAHSSGAAVALAQALVPAL